MIWQYSLLIAICLAFPLTATFFYSRRIRNPCIVFVSSVVGMVVFTVIQVALFFAVAKLGNWVTESWGQLEVAASLWDAAQGGALAGAAFGMVRACVRLSALSFDTGQNIAKLGAALVIMVVCWWPHAGEESRGLSFSRITPYGLFWPYAMSEVRYPTFFVGVEATPAREASWSLSAAPGVWFRALITALALFLLKPFAVKLDWFEKAWRGRTHRLS